MGGLIGTLLLGIINGITCSSHSSPINSDELSDLVKLGILTRTEMQNESDDSPRNGTTYPLYLVVSAKDEIMKTFWDTRPKKAKENEDDDSDDDSEELLFLTKNTAGIKLCYKSISKEDHEQQKVVYIGNLKARSLIATAFIHWFLIQKSSEFHFYWDFGHPVNGWCGTNALTDEEAQRQVPIPHDDAIKLLSTVKDYVHVPF